MNRVLDLALRFRIPQSPAAVLARLDEAQGRIVDYGSLQLALEAQTGSG